MLTALAPTTAVAGNGSSADEPIGRPQLDVTNPAIMVEWLRDEIGTRRLAGLFRRGDDLVFTPREDEDGYVPLSDEHGDVDGPAQVRLLDKDTLASRVQLLYQCYRKSKAGDITPAMFPPAAGRVACNVPEWMPNLRPLRGVVHSPVLRADGTILYDPGYDPAAKLLHLPQPGLVVPPVPERPSLEDVAGAVALLDEMVADFEWLTEHDKANYFGLLLTPLLRELIPPPYKLGAIGAPQPGSGKSLLAGIMRIVHGGVFRSEVPHDEAELRKQITSILSVTTGPVVQFDNVTGVFQSSTMSGLLTTDTWEDRPLGSTANVTRANDRLWVITGNNLKLGGDLPRRTVWVSIDPGVPHPELRTDFAIPNLEGWVRERRGELIGALLTLVRAWVVAGKPTEARGSDGFARWIEAVGGILSNAGVPGMFDHRDSVRQIVGEDDAEWLEFLEAVRRAFGDTAWTAKQVLGKVDTSSLDSNSDHPIPLGALPGKLAEKLGYGKGPQTLSKSLGRWLSNREGRWAGNLVVRAAGEDHHTALWRIEQA